MHRLRKSGFSIHKPSVLKFLALRIKFSIGKARNFQRNFKFYFSKLK